MAQQTSVRAVPSNVPDGFQYDERSGWYYHATSGYYFDANTNLYYEPTQGKYFSVSYFSVSLVSRRTRRAVPQACEQEFVERAEAGQVLVCLSGVDRQISSSVAGVKLQHMQEV